MFSIVPSQMRTSALILVLILLMVPLNTVLFEDNEIAFQTSGRSSGIDIKVDSVSLSSPIVLMKANTGCFHLIIQYLVSIDQPHCILLTLLQEYRLTFRLVFQIQAQLIQAISL